MLNPELLALLVCPETHQDVALALPEEIAQINAAIAQGALRTVGGAVVELPVEAALIRIDRRVAYPIRDGIPVMLVAEGLDLTPVKFNGNG
jgi:uncharacterized protein YbaR (Trm112 family)